MEYLGKCFKIGRLMALAAILLFATLPLSPTQNVKSDPGIVTEDLDGGALTATDLADTLLGGGSDANVSGVSYTGADLAAGTFSGGLDAVGFDSGVILSTGQVADVVGPNISDSTTTDFGTPGDPDLDTLIPGFETFDAAVLEFDFECPGIDVISFQYVFASEEYNEFVNSPFNNVFGFFLNGVNIALLPDGVTPVAINNVNIGNPEDNSPASNPEFFINNDTDDNGIDNSSINIEADGLTVVLGAQANINAGSNHIKLGVSDAGDSVLDSWVFIKEGSFQCAPLPPELRSNPRTPVGGDVFFFSAPTNPMGPLGPDISRAGGGNAIRSTK